MLADAGIPAGVVNLVTASDPVPVADELLTNRALRKISFTGSTEVGKEILRRSADQLKRVSLELGGHAPFIVCEDADPDHAAKGAAMVKLLNTGQACICPNRLYVHRSIVDRFVEVLVDRVEKMQRGQRARGRRVGRAADRRRRAGEDAAPGRRRRRAGRHRGRRWGAPHRSPTSTTAASGRPPCSPGSPPTCSWHREETFGPIAPVIAYDDEDEVIAAANDTTYGLASYVYTRDLSRAWRMAEALEYGMVGINDINPTSAAVPFGGVKESGLGREGARAGIAEYLDTRVVGIAL